MRKLLPLFRLLAPYRARIAIAVVAILLSAGMVLVIGQGLKVVIDEGFSRVEARMLDATLPQGVRTERMVASWDDLESLG